MNTPDKKLPCIIAALLAGAAFMPSCSKNTEAPKAAKAAKTQQQAVEQASKKSGKISQAAAATTAFSDGKNSLNAVRDGQYVTLNWRIDPAIARSGKVMIMRSPTGIGGLLRVAELDIRATSHKDCLPDANAYWYWARITMADNKERDIGPVKVNADKAGASNYINPADKYNASVTRILEAATITWDFPEGEYEAIYIARNRRPVAQPFNGSSAIILTTLSPKSQSSDVLPDPDFDYWYWFKIILKSGAIVYKGPIKAEYKRR